MGLCVVVVVGGGGDGGGGGGDGLWLLVGWLVAVAGGFWEARLLTNLTLLCSGLPASGPVSFRVLVQKP